MRSGAEVAALMETKRGLVQEAAEAMRANNRLPELHILAALSDATLRAIIARNVGGSPVVLGPR